LQWTAEASQARLTLCPGERPELGKLVGLIEDGHRGQELDSAFVEPLPHRAGIGSPARAHQTDGCVL